MKYTILLVTLFFIGCKNEKKEPQPQIVMNECGKYAVFTGYDEIGDKEYLGLWTHTFSIATKKEGFWSVSKDTSVIDTVDYYEEGRELIFDSKEQAQGALDSYLNKKEIFRKVAQEAAIRQKAYDDSVRKCHTYKIN